MDLTHCCFILKIICIASFRSLDLVLSDRSSLKMPFLQFVFSTFLVKDIRLNLLRCDTYW